MHRRRDASFFTRPGIIRYAILFSLALIVALLWYRIFLLRTPSLEEVQKAQQAELRRKMMPLDIADNDDGNNDENNEQPNDSKEPEPPNSAGVSDPVLRSPLQNTRREQDTPSSESTSALDNKNVKSAGVSVCPSIELEPLFVPFAEQSQPDSNSSIEDPERAFVTFVTSSDSVISASVLMYSIARSHSKYTRVVLVGSNIKLKERHYLGIFATVISVDDLPMPRFVHRWKRPDSGFSQLFPIKLRLWQLVMYRKVVYIDPNTVVLKNIDVVMETPATGFGPGYTGLLVLIPNLGVYDLLTEHLRTISFAEVRSEKRFFELFFKVQTNDGVNADALSANFHTGKFHLDEKEFGDGQHLQLFDERVYSIQMSSFDPISEPADGSSFQESISTLSGQFIGELCSFHYSRVHPETMNKIVFDPLFAWFSIYHLMLASLGKIVLDIGTYSPAESILISAALQHSQQQQQSIPFIPPKGTETAQLQLVKKRHRLIKFVKSNVGRTLMVHPRFPYKEAVPPLTTLIRMENFPPKMFTIPCYYCLKDRYFGFHMFLCDASKPDSAVHRHHCDAQCEKCQRENPVAANNQDVLLSIPLENNQGSVETVSPKTQARIRIVSLKTCTGDIIKQEVYHSDQILERDNGLMECQQRTRAKQSAESSQKLEASFASPPQGLLERIYASGQTCQGNCNKFYCQSADSVIRYDCENDCKNCDSKVNFQPSRCVSGNGKFSPLSWSSLPLNHWRIQCGVSHERRKPTHVRDTPTTCVTMTISFLSTFCDADIPIAPQLPKMDNGTIVVTPKVCSDHGYLDANCHCRCFEGYTGHLCESMTATTVGFTGENILHESFNAAANNVQYNLYNLLLHRPDEVWIREIKLRFIANASTYFLPGPDGVSLAIGCADEAVCRYARNKISSNLLNTVLTFREQLQPGIFPGVNCQFKDRIGNNEALKTSFLTIDADGFLRHVSPEYEAPYTLCDMPIAQNEQAAATNGDSLPSSDGTRLLLIDSQPRTRDQAKNMCATFQAKLPSFSTADAVQKFVALSTGKGKNQKEAKMEAFTDAVYDGFGAWLWESTQRRFCIMDLENL